MSLLKQLFLAICLFLVVAFSGSFVSSVENSREQLRGQLRSHAQDAATALGLSLTPHVDDPAMVQLMVSSIFDSGYFASIRVIDIKSGKPLVERVQAHDERTVPGWFARLVDLQPQGGDALIMRGWEQAARVEVVSHPQFALARLWDSALGSLYWLLACGAASLLLGGWLLRRQLRPLDQMVRQAHAISRREFLSLPRLPRTPELRRVVQAMNQMVEKLRTLFAEEAARSDKLRAQAYQDSLTGLPNRRLFDARLNEQLGAGEHEHAGQLLLLRLNDLNGLNQRLGGQRTDELIQAVARLLVDSCGQQGRADWLLARSRGGEFAVLAPGCSREQAERLAEELCEGLENLARTGASDLTPVAYLGISAFAEGDSPADLLAGADQALAQAESQPAQPWASQSGTALQCVVLEHPQGRQDRLHETVGLGPVFRFHAEAQRAEFAARTMQRHGQPIHQAGGRGFLEELVLLSRLVDGRFPENRQYALGTVTDRRVDPRVASPVVMLAPGGRVVADDEGVLVVLAVLRQQAEEDLRESKVARHLLQDGAPLQFST